MIQRLGSNKAPYLGRRTSCKISEILNNTNNFDKMNISETGRARVPKVSILSQEEKVANRRRIDFCEGSIGFDSYTLSFSLPDGSRIPMEDVASEIGEEEITSTIEVLDNKLDLKPNTYGKWVAPNGKEHVVRITKNGVHLSSSAVSILSDPAYNKNVIAEPAPVDREVWDAMTLLDLMSDDSTSGLSVVGIYQFYSDEKLNSLLDYLGFNPGKIEIDIGKGPSIYFRDEKYGIYSGTQSESTLNAVNHTNFIKEYNVTQGAVYIIDGKEYPMDEAGFFHIPSGVMCVPNSMKLVDKNGKPFQLKGW